MYEAYREGTLSKSKGRKVGAVVVDNGNKILCRGHNDKPKVGGGYKDKVETEQETYNYKTTIKDLKKGIIDNIRKNFKIDPLTGDNSNNDNNELIKCFKPLDNILEYFQEIHAEPSALYNIKDKHTKMPDGCKMYVTTLPCHLCQKDIIFSGIKQCYYIKPYEKVNKHMFKNDIFWLPEEEEIMDQSENRVKMKCFFGIGPERYEEFFPETADGNDKLSLNRLDADKIKENFKSYFKKTQAMKKLKQKKRELENSEGNNPQTKCIEETITYCKELKLSNKALKSSK